MKKGILQMSLLLLLVGAVTFPFTVPGGAEPRLASFQVGDKFTSAGIKLPDDMYVLDAQQGDVTGNNVLDNVILLGKKENPDDTWTSQISVVVQDGKTGEFSRLKDEEMIDFNGYSPSLFIYDFTGDAVLDIMVSVRTGGSGGIIRHLIIDWKEDQKIIFNDEQNKGLQVTGNFVDDWKAELTSQKIHKTFTVDISSFKKDFQSFDMYDKSGKYIGKMESPMIVSDDFSRLEPIDIDGDGIYELVGNQLVWGPAHANGITHIESTWKYKEGKWAPVRAEYTITKTIFP